MAQLDRAEKKNFSALEPDLLYDGHLVLSHSKQHLDVLCVYTPVAERSNVDKSQLACLSRLHHFSIYAIVAQYFMLLAFFGAGISGSGAESCRAVWRGAPLSGGAVRRHEEEGRTGQGHHQR